MDEIQAQINDHLQRLLQTALGPAHRVANLTRLCGSSKKGVYQATFDTSSAIMYVWDTSENYWFAGVDSI